MSDSVLSAFVGNFLGPAPTWYKKAIVYFLIVNPILLMAANPFVTGWILIAQFIFVLSMALKCYPLQPGGLLAIEAIIMGMATPEKVFEEVVHNIEVVFLLIFMVAGIYFMKELLLYVFRKIVLRIRSKAMLSVMVVMAAATLSAFLDALTVTAGLISVCLGFYTIYQQVASGKKLEDTHLKALDDEEQHTFYEYDREDLEAFRAFLRSLIMHGAVGTALGGVCTLVGEPQNLLIAKVAGWDFIEFFLQMAPVTLPVMVCGLLTSLILEWTGWFGYGAEIPRSVRLILDDVDRNEDAERTYSQKAALVVQGVVVVILIFALAFHVTEVGMIGLMIIIIQTAFNGIVEEHQLGRAFEEGLPFTALVFVFLVFVAIIEAQHLFDPIGSFVFSFELGVQPAMLFVATGVLSMISDNVFVATVYINEVKDALDRDVISREHFNKLVVAINTGTNLPSVATPNGQAAFLFLLTSSLSPIIRMSYLRMVYMALPYTVILGISGFLLVVYKI